MTRHVGDGRRHRVHCPVPCEFFSISRYVEPSNPAVLRRLSHYEDMVPCHFFSRAGEVGQFATRVVQELPAIARFWGHSLRTISLPMFTNLPEEVAWHLLGHLGPRSNELSQIQKLVEEHQQDLLEAGDEFFDG